MRQPDGRYQHVLLAINQGCRIERSQLKAVAMGDGIGGAGLHAVSAEDTPIIVNVVNLGIPFSAGDSLLGRVLGRLDIDAVGGACRRAQEAGNTFLQTILIPLQHMGAAEAILKVSTTVGSRSIRVVLHFGGLQHLTKRDAHSLGYSRYVSHNGHDTSIRCRRRFPSNVHGRSAESSRGGWTPS